MLADHLDSSLAPMPFDDHDSAGSSRRQPTVPRRLLAAPLPRFPLPALRRLYQRAAYAWYRIEDEWL